MRRFFHLTAAAAVLLFFTCVDNAHAVMDGPCGECHTMHNSQNNQPMRYDNSDTPLGQLLRGDCYGCHARGGTQALFPVGIDSIPQVYHNDTVKGLGLISDLAGGNFAYLDGLKGGAAADSKGHNIVDLVGADGNLTAPPGGFKSSAMGEHPADLFAADELTCAGTRGCHGNRNSGMAGYEGITGAHHNNSGPSITQLSSDIEPGHGYRFLLGVNGYEDTDWQYTKSASDHNEYAGRATPIQVTCDTNLCHSGTSGGVRPPNGTMAEYCATCHGNFHSLSVGLADDSLGNGAGVGPGGASPWLRHPSDLSIPAEGDYLNYTVYEPNTPVARIGGAYATGPSDTVTPGTDAVFCLSCHVAHGSPYPDMLKWDYSTMQVGTGAVNQTGCFTCHRNK